MKCPYCQSLIDDDSRYCDQCGTKLMFCPSCAQPKKGSSCPRCGEVLVSGDEFFDAPKKKNPMDFLDFGVLRNTSLSLVGEGMSLELKEGEFGRKCGVYPEFSKVPTISGRHGKIMKSGSGSWAIVDLGSTNGTYVDGSRLQAGQPCELKAGMSVKIANLKFTVK